MNETAWSSGLGSLRPAVVVRGGVLAPDPPRAGVLVQEALRGRSAATVTLRDRGPAAHPCPRCP
eukprot:7819750-Alexandrium_andersonii.AAC.1